MTPGESPSNEHLARLNEFQNIMESGLALDSQPPLLPTLIIEAVDEIRLAVLDPAPEPEETFAAAMQWKQAVLDDEEDAQPHCVGFTLHPNEIALGVFPPADGHWFMGRIHPSTGIVEWRPSDKPV